jgi:hypothetical protein
VAEALFNLNAHSRTIFSLSNVRDVHLMGQGCHVRLSKVNDAVSSKDCIA